MLIYLYKKKNTGISHIFITHIKNTINTTKIHKESAVWLFFPQSLTGWRIINTKINKLIIVAVRIYRFEPLTLYRLVYSQRFERILPMQIRMMLMIYRKIIKIHSKILHLFKYAYKS